MKKPKKNLPESGMTLAFQAKLAAIVVHADELTSPGGHEFDAAALRALVQDPDVVRWIKSLGPLAPLKRTAR